MATANGKLTPRDYISIGGFVLAGLSLGGGIATAFFYPATSGQVLEEKVVSLQRDRDGWRKLERNVIRIGAHLNIPNLEE